MPSCPALSDSRPRASAAIASTFARIINHLHQAPPHLCPAFPMLNPIHPMHFA
jgi:hypothetical protein